MKFLYAVFIACLIGFYFLDDSGQRTTVATPMADSVALLDAPVTSRERREPAAASPTAASTAAAEFSQADAGTQVRGSGTVTRVLSDDNSGSRHQRFILRLGSGQTVLVAHNIDLAPRVAGIAVNDRVDFNGEYEWNSKGGVVHWTHHDPAGRHTDGWLRSKGRTYQ